MNIRQAYRRLKKFLNPQGLVLMYHRIATPITDPWQLAVSPENFEKHLQILKKTKKVIPLPQLVNQIHKKKLKKNAIAITFDDGYIDNYLTAKPLLEHYGLPATFFVTTSTIGLHQEFWWDELEHIIINSPELPAVLSFEIGNKPFYFDLAHESILTDELRQKHQVYVAYEPPTRRAQLYYQLWELFTPLVSQEQQRLLQLLKDWAFLKTSYRPAYCSMSKAQLSELASNSLFCLGGHTHTHPALAYHNKEFQQHEITKNRAFLKNLTGKEASLFAYPSGIYDATTFKVLEEEGFNAGFTTNYGLINKDDNPFQLNRVQINNWDRKQLEWLISTSFD